ncbi:MAG: hypothetical protein AB203_00660 [Parcubacteria bacterium C7867-008]|nr:MAG: hypothetical protein AB203_00660 [Parcubacteria bacterium C7867-008]
MPGDPKGGHCTPNEDLFMNRSTLRGTVAALALAATTVVAPVAAQAQTVFGPGDPPIVSFDCNTWGPPTDSDGNPIETYGDCELLFPLTGAMTSTPTAAMSWKVTVTPTFLVGAGKHQG